MSFMQDFSGFFGTLGNLVQGFANYGLQSANFDYQRALQQQIFNREDTSYQRQVADLEAAGLNKYAVAGGANAGSVVSTSAPQMNFGFDSRSNPGQIVDTLRSVMQLKSMEVGYKEQLQSLKNQKIQNSILSQNSVNKSYANLMKKAELMYLSGSRGMKFVQGENGLTIVTDPKATKLGADITGLDSVLGERVKNAELLDKELEFYDSDKILQYLGGALKALK